MRAYSRSTFLSLVFLAAISGVSCLSSPDASLPPPAESPVPAATQVSADPLPTSTPTSTPAVPNLQSELTDDRGKTTTSPIGSFDFQNFTYPLPRGWQHQDADEIVLENGKLEPRIADDSGDKKPDEKAAARAARRIGMSHVATRFLDIDSDGQDEAVVLLKVETGGSAVPQLVYIFRWLDGKPELLWNFRTGDRADGGLKDIRSEEGQLVVELFGRDRFLLGETETGKVTGDEEQLCCPTHFTKTKYKWNGKNFLLQGKRLTYLLADPAAPPYQNLGEILNDPVKAKKYFDNELPAGQH